MFKTFAKFLFAGALLYWLITSGKLDFTLVKKSFHVGPQWIVAISLIFAQIVLGALRYKLLLETKTQKSLRFLDILRLNYIGLFFSSVLPGAVTGDIIKLVYIKKSIPHFKKTFLVSITLLDRIMGLSGLLFLAGIFSLYSYNQVTALSPKIAHLIHVNLLLFLGTTFFLVILISPQKVQTTILNYQRKIPFLGEKIANVSEQVFGLRENRLDIFKSFLLSVACQFLSILAFWTVMSPFLEKPLPFQYAFTFIPVGLITMAIPISPGGLGVGHVLFANLFSLVGINSGASLFNLFYLCNLANNAIGIIPYLMIDKKKDR